ncbi:MAG: type II toxin-antitoxin system RatA family toxin [Pseudomonadota bacterium]
MRKIIKQKDLPHSPSQLFELVADIDRYHEFLPWCLHSRTWHHAKDSCRAELAVGNRFIQQSYISDVHFEPPNLINVALVSGPLRAMENRWRFEPRPDGHCRVDFYLAFELQSSLLSGVMNRLFAHAFDHMMAAFEKRARALYQTAPDSKTS